jgi:hypothetical protein
LLKWSKRMYDRRILLTHPNPIQDLVCPKKQSNQRFYRDGKYCRH